MLLRSAVPCFALLVLAIVSLSLTPMFAQSAFRPFGPSNVIQNRPQPNVVVPNAGFYQQNNTYYSNYSPYPQQTIIINRSCGQRAGAFSAQGLSVPQRVGPAPALPTWGVGMPATGRTMPERTVGGPPQLR